LNSALQAIVVALQFQLIIGPISSGVILSDEVAAATEESKDPYAMPR
jgi:orotate phosphoribosyltransferase